jgi:hypothetical protein
MKRRLIILILFIICTLFVLCLLFSWGIALTVGLLIIGTIGYLEKIINIEIPKILRILLLSIFISLSVGNLIYSKYKENSINFKLQEANEEGKKLRQELQNQKEEDINNKRQISDLKMKTSSQEERQDVIQEYSEVASWNFQGSLEIGSGVAVSSPVSNWTNNFVKEKDGQISWQCSSDALVNYKRITNKYPKYPFPYYLITLCLKNANDPSWKIYARKGLDICNKTTMVPKHSPSHDDVLKRLKELLKK